MSKEGPLRKWFREREPLIPRKGILGSLFSPELAVYPPVDKELETMREAKKREWLAKGYPEALVEKALLLADRWVSSMAAAFGADKPEVREAIIRGSYPKALEVAQAWITAMMK